jgi:hypothetical protein
METKEEKTSNTLLEKCMDAPYAATVGEVLQHYQVSVCVCVYECCGCECWWWRWWRVVLRGMGCDVYIKCVCVYVCDWQQGHKEGFVAAAVVIDEGLSGQVCVCVCVCVSVCVYVRTLYVFCAYVA